MKIFTTAIFAVLILSKRIGFWQWIALLILFIGVCLVQIPSDLQKDNINLNKNHNKQYPLFGFIIVLLAALLSGFTGVYFEKMLKGINPVSLWGRNVQLATVALPISFLICIFFNGKSLMEENLWFYGFDIIVWSMVVWYGLGGLIVALTLKYADNILKDLATGSAIVLSTTASIYIFNFIPNRYFIIGALTTIFSIFLYSSKFAAIKKSYEFV